MRYDHEVTIRRPTMSADDREFVADPVEVATGVECRIEEEHGRMVLTETGLSVKYDAIMLFDPSIDLRPGAGHTEPDEIVQTTPPTGATYRVLSVADEAGTGVYLTAKLTRVGITDLG